MLAAFALHVYHALQLVVLAETAAPLRRDIEGWMRGAALVLAAFALHVYHALQLVVLAETSAPLRGEIEGWLRGAALVLAAFAMHVYHALQLVVLAETAARLRREIEGWMRGAALVLAAFVLHVYHALQLVVLAETAEPLRGEIEDGALPACSFLTQAGRSCCSSALEYRGAGHAHQRHVFIIYVLHSVVARAHNRGSEADADLAADLAAERRCCIECRTIARSLWPTPTL